jgi:hypothetical protein
LESSNASLENRRIPTSKTINVETSEEEILEEIYNTSLVISVIKGQMTKKQEKIG